MDKAKQVTGVSSPNSLPQEITDVNKLFLIYYECELQFTIYTYMYTTTCTCSYMYTNLDYCDMLLS